jgi:hypothetical protein
MATRSGAAAAWAFVSGLALGVAGMVFWFRGPRPIKKTLPRRRKEDINTAGQEEGIYCSVPEGADICFPEQQKV